MDATELGFIAIFVLKQAVWMIGMIDAAGYCWPMGWRVGWQVKVASNYPCEVYNLQQVLLAT